MAKNLSVDLAELFDCFGVMNERYEMGFFRLARKSTKGFGFGG